MERKRQERIHELIMTEEKYVADLHTAVEVRNRILTCKLGSHSNIGSHDYFLILQKLLK